MLDVSTVLGRALIGIASGAVVVALWLWGTGLFVSSTSARLNGLLVMPPAWEAASWSLCVIVFAAVVPLLVDLMWHSPSYRLLSVGEWSVVRAEKYVRAGQQASTC